MANFNPLGYTGKVTGSTTRLGVVEFNPSDFSVDENGVVSLGGTGAVQTINSLLPTAGNIVIAGTTNQIGIANAGSTITLSLPSAITAPGSLTTTTTLAAGTALSAGTTITAGTGITSTTGNIVAAAGGISATLGSVSAGTTVTAGTSITATLGAITATNGNLVLNTAGNGVRVKSGANARVGIGAILSGGALAVANTSVTTNTVVIPIVTALGTVTASQALRVTKSAGVGFTVTSADATDTSTFDWYLVEAI